MLSEFCNLDDEPNEWEFFSEASETYERPPIFMDGSYRLVREDAPVPPKAKGNMLEKIIDIVDSVVRLFGEFVETQKKLAEANASMADTMKRQFETAEKFDKVRLAQSERIVSAQESLAQGIVPEKESWEIDPGDDSEDEMDTTRDDGDDENGEP